MMTPELKERLKGLLLTRSQTYKRVFSGPVGERVLRDLAKFCRAHESTVQEDSHLSAVAEGRREVWLRIQQHMNMSQEELWNLTYGRGE